MQNICSFLTAATIHVLDNILDSDSCSTSIMTALFGNVSGDSGSSKNLVEFRAGKMQLNGTTVSSDKRKGLVYVYQSDDSLMHFCWKDRTSGVVEDDLIIFPDDVEWRKVPQCTTGRVFVLKFKLSSRKFFFWMQEPKTDKDSEYCKKVNDFLNNPPPPGSSGGGSSAGGLSSLAPLLGDQLGERGLQTLLNSMDQNQLLQILGMPGLGASADESSSRSSSRAATSQSQSETKESESNSQTPRTPPTGAESQRTGTPAATTKDSEVPSAPGRPATRHVVQLSDLQNILSTMQVPVPGATSERSQAVDLSRSFNTEALAPILSDPEVQTRLSPYLPEVKDLSLSEDEVKATIQSPQFKQALSSFSAALQSGQLAPLVQQFGLGKDAVEASSRGDILGFVRALQNAEKPSEGDDDEEEMAVD